jgi:hypothetical protein
VGTSIVSRLREGGSTLVLVEDDVCSRIVRRSRLSMLGYVRIGVAKWGESRICVLTITVDFVHVCCWDTAYYALFNHFGIFATDMFDELKIFHCNLSFSSVSCHTLTSTQNTHQRLNAFQLLPLQDLLLIQVDPSFNHLSGRCDSNYICDSSWSLAIWIS